MILYMTLALVAIFLTAIICCGMNTGFWMRIFHDEFNNWSCCPCSTIYSPLQMEAFNPTMPQLEIPLKKMVSKEDCLAVQLRRSDEEVVDLSCLDDAMPGLQTMLLSGGGTRDTPQTHPGLQHDFVFEDVYNNSAAASGAPLVAILCFLLILR